MERSVFYDLACENFEKKETKNQRSNVWESPSGNLQLLWGEDEHHGAYTIFFTQPFWLMEEECFFETRKKLSEELFRLFSQYIGKEKTLLVAGLGNPKMTADALGAEVVDRVTVTRKILFEEERSRIRVSAVSMGVLGNTGIETVEHLRGICEQIRPNVVLAVDALSSKSKERLGATIQLSSGGISPGSGVDMAQTRLSQSTVGVPVISLGVPTVIHSSSILRAALEELGIEDREQSKKILEREKGLFVMPKESDLLLRSAATLLASAIDLACHSFASNGIY